MKRTKADIAFSNFIRERDNWQCQKCSREFNRDCDTTNLHCSHFKGRRNQAARYDPENCIALCLNCHKYFDEQNRQAYTDFKINQLGEKRFKECILIWNGYKKKNDKANYLLWKKNYIELCKEKNINPRKI